MKGGKYAWVELTRDCRATQIPSGDELFLSQGNKVMITQALGGNYTIQTEMGHLALIDGADADVLGFSATSKEAGEAQAGDEEFSIEKVMDKLRLVFDPEIPVNVVDLGLIYECEAYPLPDGNHRIEIKMSMTAPGCGMGDILKKDAKSKIEPLAGVGEVDIEIVWEPPWDPSRMSDAARLQLGMF